MEVWVTKLCLVKADNVIIDLQKINVSDHYQTWKKFVQKKYYHLFQVELKLETTVEPSF